MIWYGNKAGFNRIMEKEAQNYIILSSIKSMRDERYN